MVSSPGRAYLVYTTNRMALDHAYPREHMAHVAQIRTEEEAAIANWPCHWCAHGEILLEIIEHCDVCRKQEYNSKPTEFKVAEIPR